MQDLANVFENPVSREVWNWKYRLIDEAGSDSTIRDTWRRVARALANAEPELSASWERAFLKALEDFRFLPGGRILAGAGSQHDVTLFNCFVLGTIEDSMEGIFSALKEAALTMQQGGGIGYDFSTLRPAGMPARRCGGVASGPVSFMRIWDSMCATLLAAGARRGAMMATLRCDHPDIETFIGAKRTLGELRNFNLSVLITDDFMDALEQDRDWPLVFPINTEADPPDAGQIVFRRWSHTGSPVPCRIVRVSRARELWHAIMRSTYDYAEPGVLFIDRINRQNNLWYCEHISATNPCGEIPLPAYGACNLGSINLTRFVSEPFEDNAALDFAAIERTAAVAVRMLDNVIDASRFPLPKQRDEALGKRRIGLGITGLADALVMLGLRYDDERACQLADKIMRSVCLAAYRTSIELAREKGSFPCLDRDKYLQSNFVRTLPRTIRKGIAEHGIRNSHLLAVAPTGSISLLANNVSNGLEPGFDERYQRRVLTPEGPRNYDIENYAVRLWRLSRSERTLPPAFVTTSELSPLAHLRMQAAIQHSVDNAISKTVYLPQDFPFPDMESLYRQAYDMGLKGCTTYRPNPITGVVISPTEPLTASTVCCEQNA
ncbi:adenosylcobalamin-dependent ribonucleoside-diphosphate reductase [Methylocaldum sp.]|uniref:adenosylcobalamin-dependent ribonucleoside-diphosphate reductase n=1 Tax=Methylocaldum sp. TaxID=1969727 RepID=UPI002D493687|nr:adenosylcobalamin-dependent ribonucleoside-diphosphate reductase [Methylocaldum sp.]HYE35150.1 adenosylcobalamin-dependent ribonucleoside-diphosphate reductase [Methylocaldum sp.]